MKKFHKSLSIYLFFDTANNELISIFDITDILFGTIFLNLKVHKILIRNTPLENIEEYVFYGANETLIELEFMNTSFTTFPMSFKVSIIR